MAKRELRLVDLAVNNFTTEEVLSECIHQLAPKMTEEALGEKKIYWDILQALTTKVSGGKSAKIL